MLREDMIGVLSHLKPVSESMLHGCTKLLLLKSRFLAPSLSIVGMSTLTGAKLLSSLSEISPILALYKGANSDVGEEEVADNIQLPPKLLSPALLKRGKLGLA